MDRRGNVLAITAAALPLVIGSAGLATDTIQWSTWNRQLQRAADSAAFAAVYAKAQQSPVEGNSGAVKLDLARNNYTPPTLLSGYPKIGYPTVSTYTNAVSVTLAVQQELPFSSMFLSAAPIIEVSATAAMVDDGEYCVRALYKGKEDPGIVIGGSSNSVLGCNALSNGTSATESVKVNGSAHNFVAPKVAGAGGMPSAINGTTTVAPYQMALPDPFEGKYPTDVPESEKPCNNKVQNNTATLFPGCYSEFKFTGNGTYNLSSGTYYLDSTSFDVQGDVTIKGTDVTIILTGTTPGSIKLNANATIQLAAPTTGTYEKMLFIQAANATVDNTNTINGNASSKFDGAIYFPKGKVEFSGSNGSMTKCVMVIGYKVVFTGNSNLQNDTVGCVANKTVTGKVVRLVA